MKQLDGKVCVVTGGAGSLGLASARRFLAEGARVMLVDRDADRLASAIADLAIQSDRVATTLADVTDGVATKDYFERTVATWGKIDILFSNAGVSGVSVPVIDYPEDVFDTVMAVNVRASFLACKYGLPQMNDGGSVILTSSIMGVTANPNMAGYATSKHALIGLMRTVSKEVAPRNIRVNVIAPGPVDNAFQMEIEDRQTQATGRNMTDMINQRIPLGRHASEDEIAQTVLYLASDQSSFSTGSVFMADGGLNA